MRISAKHLGVLAMPDHCQFCFWLQMRMGWKAPFAVFPGIFSSLDSYSKRIVAAHNASHGWVPPWLSCGTPIGVPHWSKFAWLDEPTDMLLVGAPDEILRLPSGRLGIYDYKTARHTTGQDRLLPMYQVQLNAYAWLGARLGFGETEELALVYCEPVTDCSIDTLVGHTDVTGFALRFSTKMVTVDVCPEIVPSLLAEARRIADLEDAPLSREGCKDCLLVGQLLAMAAEVGSIS